MGTEQTGPLHNNIWYCLIVLDGELCKITDSKKLILRGILTLVTLHSEAVVGTASLQEGIKVRQLCKSVEEKEKTVFPR